MRGKLALLFLILFTVGFNSVFAYNKQYTDSLASLLPSKNGVQKLEIYSQLVAALRNFDPAKGIDFAQEGLLLANQIGDETYKIKILNEEGVCYRKLHIYDKALNVHFEVLKKYEGQNDSMGIAFTLANIGNVYYATEDVATALTFHLKSLVIKEHLKDELQIAYSLNAIGMDLIKMKDPKRAIDYLNRTIELRKKNNDLIELANTYGTMGDALIAVNQFDKAQEDLKLAEEIYTRYKVDSGLAVIYNKMAELLLLRGDFVSSAKLLKQSEVIALQLNNFSVLYNNYNTQSKIFRETKQFEEAYEYSNKAWTTRDSMMSERKHYEIEEIRIRYETDKIDTDNEILRLKVKEQDLRLKYFSILLVSLILLVIVFLAFWRFRKNKKMSVHLKQVNHSLEERVEERTKELVDQIAAREATLVSLKQSEEKFKTITETSPSGIIVTDKNRKVLFINNRLTEVTGIPENEFLDDKWISHVIDEERVKVNALWEIFGSKEDTVSEISFRMIVNETVNWFHLKAAPMMHDDHFMGFVALLDNITDQKEFELELIQSKKRAEESDKLKSAFLANMSHEIRTPMNAILGFSDLLSSDEYDETEKAEFVSMIKASGRLLLNLINDIIDISKIEAGELKIQPSSFQIVSLLDESYLTFKQQLDHSEKKGIKLVFNHRADIENAWILTDRLRLQQILTNLLSNALKFTHQGEIEIGVLLINNQFQFYVRDSGIGIPASKLEVVFERFRQADDSHTRVYGGTGLGLAITKNLVHLLGGNIWVESVEKHGTVFYFTLPTAIDEDDNNRNSERVALSLYPDYKGKTVLLAEDVETNHKLMGSMLRRMNFNMVYALNGFIALDLAVKIKPDVILMDVQMPEMDGIEAMNKIKEHQLNIPIIAITAFSLMDQDQKYLDMGFDAFISKPFNIETLIVKFKRIFDKKNEKINKS